MNLVRLTSPTDFAAPVSAQSFTHNGRIIRLGDVVTLHKRRCEMERGSFRNWTETAVGVVTFISRQGMLRIGDHVGFQDEVSV